MLLHYCVVSTARWRQSPGCQHSTLTSLPVVSTARWRQSPGCQHSTLTSLPVVSTARWQVSQLSAQHADKSPSCQHSTLTTQLPAARNVDDIHLILLKWNQTYFCNIYRYITYPFTHKKLDLICKLVLLICCRLENNKKNSKYFSALSSVGTLLKCERTGRE